MKVVIISQVEHDAKLLEVGAEVDLPKEVAETLIESGAAEAKQDKAKAKASTEE